jgi:ABC-2 type transport system ATP-binding protein
MTSPGTLALATRGLRKSYGSRLALDGLDLSVPQGVVYGFLGPNGAGKTTTMRLLTGLLHPDAGTIELLGSPFRRGDRKRLFQVGALVESPSFYPYLDGRQNLKALAASGAAVPAGRIEELLELVGLRDRAKDKVAGYSLGMKQRLGIAGALLSDPRLLLLDEPANGLDPAGVIEIRELIRRLAMERGVTIFMSSHILAEVERLATRIGIVHRGRLIEELDADALEAQADKRLEVAARDLDAAERVLLAAGLSPAHASAGDNGRLELRDRRALDAPDEIARLLASAGVPPLHLAIARESLEEHFVRLTSAIDEGDVA